jgi:predicted transposase/invertase (TIGR01784 family)
LKEGEKKGRKEEKIEIAKKGLEKGTSIELISELTGLSKAEIERL